MKPSLSSKPNLEFKVIRGVIFVPLELLRELLDVRLLLSQFNFSVLRDLIMLIHRLFPILTGVRDYHQCIVIQHILYSQWHGEELFS